MANGRSLGVNLGGEHVIAQENGKQDAGQLCDVGGAMVGEGRTGFFSCAPWMSNCGKV